MLKLCLSTVENTYYFKMCFRKNNNNKVNNIKNNNKVH